MSDEPFKTNLIAWLREEYATMKSENNTGPDVMVEVYVKEILDRIENGGFDDSDLSDTRVQVVVSAGQVCASCGRDHDLFILFGEAEAPACLDCLKRAVVLAEHVSDGLNKKDQ